MDIVIGILKAGLMMAAIALVIGAVAALFMIIFGIATGMDDKMQS